MAPWFMLYGNILSLDELNRNVKDLFLDDFIDLSLPKEHESIFTKFASNLSMEAPR
jgi:hypothetical protein